MQAVVSTDQCSGRSPSDAGAVVVGKRGAAATSLQACCKSSKQRRTGSSGSASPSGFVSPPACQRVTSPPMSNPAADTERAPEVKVGDVTPKSNASLILLNGAAPEQLITHLHACGVLPSAAPDEVCFVTCGSVHGVFALAHGAVVCMCEACAHATRQRPVWFPPAAFERHGGMAASKKWRGSIQVSVT